LCTYFLQHISFHSLPLDQLSLLFYGALRFPHLRCIFAVSQHTYIRTSLTSSHICQGHLSLPIFTGGNTNVCLGWKTCFSDTDRACCVYVRVVDETLFIALDIGFRQRWWANLLESDASFLKMARYLRTRASRLRKPRFSITKCRLLTLNFEDLWFIFTYLLLLTWMLKDSYYLLSIWFRRFFPIQSLSSMIPGNSTFLLENSVRWCHFYRFMYSS